MFAPGQKAHHCCIATLLSKLQWHLSVFMPEQWLALASSVAAFLLFASFFLAPSGSAAAAIAFSLAAAALASAFAFFAALMAAFSSYSRNVQVVRQSSILVPRL